jgi:hypothetical protein
MKTRRIHSLSIGASALFAFSLTTTAQFFNESFDYTPGSTVSGQSGGTGFTGAWVEGGDLAELDTIQAPGLSYPLYPSLGNAGLSVPPSDFVQAPFRASISIPGTAGTTAWVSYLVRKDSNNTTGIPVGEDYFGLTLYGTGSGGNGLLLGDSGESANFALGTAGSLSNPGEISTTPVGLGSTALVIAKIEFTGLNETVTLYVNPDLSLGEAGLVAAASKSDLDLGDVTSLGFVASHNPVYSYDELRGASSFAGLVAPLPDGGASAAWILLPCFLSAAVRRYRARNA